MPEQRKTLQVSASTWKELNRIKYEKSLPNLGEVVAQLLGKTYPSTLPSPPP